MKFRFIKLKESLESIDENSQTFNNAKSAFGSTRLRTSNRGGSDMLADVGNTGLVYIHHGDSDGKNNSNENTFFVTPKQHVLIHNLATKRLLDKFKSKYPDIDDDLLSDILMFVSVKDKMSSFGNKKYSRIDPNSAEDEFRDIIGCIRSLQSEYPNEVEKATIEILGIQ